VATSTPPPTITTVTETETITTTSTVVPTHTVTVTVDYQLQLSNGASNNCLYDYTNAVGVTDSDTPADALQSCANLCTSKADTTSQRSMILSC
jgi:hypothetical protein